MAIISLCGGIFSYSHIFESIYQRLIGIIVYINSTRYNNVEKAFQSNLDTLQKPFNKHVCDSIFVLLETWKIEVFSFQAFLPNISVLLVQSRPTENVCILLRQRWEIEPGMYRMRCALAAKVYLMQRRKAKPAKLTGGPGGPLGPGGPGAPMGTSP